MKFGKYLELYKIPEWAQKYLDYKFLKKLLKELQQILKERGLPGLSETDISFFSSQCDAEEHSLLQDESPRRSKDFFQIIRKKSLFPGILEEEQEGEESEVAFQNEKLHDEESVIQHWIMEYLANLERINKFYLEQLADITGRLEQVKISLTRKTEDLNFIRTTIKHSINGAKDELNYATCWNRAFADILRLIRWLDGFCNINLLSTRKILKKFSKILGGNRKTDYVSELKHTTMQMDFAHSGRLAEIKKYLMDFYSSIFTEGNPHEARSMLERSQPSYQVKDNLTSSFFCGVLCALAITSAIILLIPGETTFEPSVLFAIIPVFRYIFIIDLALFGCAIIVNLFRKYSVNYYFIFGLDPTFRIRELQIRNVAIIVLCLWFLCFFMQIITLKYDFLPTHTSIFSFLLIAKQNTSHSKQKVIYQIEKQYGQNSLSFEGY